MCVSVAYANSRGGSRRSQIADALALWESEKEMKKRVCGENV